MRREGIRFNDSLISFTALRPEADQAAACVSD